MWNMQGEVNVSEGGGGGWGAVVWYEIILKGYVMARQGKGNNGR